MKITRTLSLTLSVAVLSLSGARAAVAAQVPLTPTNNAEAAAGATTMTADEANKATSQFEKWNFGASLGVMYYLADRVDTASVDPAGVVRVDKDAQVSTTALLELHYFFPYSKDGVRTIDTTSNTIGVMTSGHGPFVGVVVAGNDGIDAMGGGWMWGWRRAQSAEQLKAITEDGVADLSFNVGLGLMVDPDAKLLARGFEADRPAPLDGEGSPQAIRYREKWAVAPMILVSFSW